MIWFAPINIEEIKSQAKGTLSEHLGMELVEIGPDYISGTMPVDSRTKQSFGIVHGGANCSLAETLGSLAANLVCNPKTHQAVGLSITTNHIKAVRNGLVHGVARPIHLGRSTHVWEIKTTDDSGNLTSLTNLTMAIIDKRS